MSLKHILFVLLPLIFAAPLPAQEGGVEIERSEETVEIDGKKYYVHTVKKGETLYSISRAYNVSQKDILLKNPSAYVGLQIDQVLHIPVEEEEEPEEEERDTEKYVYHEIEKGQTLFFISQTYNVSPEEIENLNPELEVDNLQIGEVVKVPRHRPTLARKGFEPEDDRFAYHRIEEGETRSSIAEKHGIDVMDLLRANEKLVWGLRPGEFVRIPDDSEAVAEKEATEDVPVEEEEAYEDLEAADADCIDFDYDRYGRAFDVAIMLPFFIDRNYPVEEPDSLAIDAAGVEGVSQLQPMPQHVESLDELYSSTVPYLEFYEGVLIALDSLKKTGLSVNLHVYDTQRDPSKVKEILEKPEMEDMDLVVGPVWPEPVRIVSQWSKEKGVNVVSPFSSRSDILSENPRLFQITPSLDTELEQAAYFMSNYSDHNIVVIHSGNIYDMETVEKLEKNLSRTRHDSSDMSYREVVYNDTLGQNLRHSLRPDRPNLVVIPSSNQAFVAGVLNWLNIITTRNGYDITLFGLSDWSRFYNIDVELFHSMELHYASPFFIEYDCGHVRSFLRKFREEYNTEPDHYGFTGYDVTMYFMKALKNFGPEFQDCLPLLNVDLLQGDFMFRRSRPGYGFENNGLSIVKYASDKNVLNLGLDRDPISVMFSGPLVEEEEDDTEGDEEEDEDESGREEDD